MVMKKHSLNVAIMAGAVMIVVIQKMLESPAVDILIRVVMVRKEPFVLLMDTLLLTHLVDVLKSSMMDSGVLYAMIL